MFEITYHPSVPNRDLPKLSKTELRRVHNVIETKLKITPGLYGVRLRGELKEYWKLRIGDFRIVYRIETRKEVFILAIGNRKEVYKTADKRI